MALVGGVAVLALVAGSLGAAIGVSLASKHGSESPAVTPATAPSGGATTTPIPSPGSGTTPTTVPASGSGASAPALSGAALDVKGILAKVEPSVVDIVAQSRRETGEGTGFLAGIDPGCRRQRAILVQDDECVEVLKLLRAFERGPHGADCTHLLVADRRDDLGGGG